MAITFVSRRLCGVVKNKAPNKPLRWFSPLMAAASRAIVERIPQVDFTLEVRDARIPISSGYEYTGYFPSSSQRIIVLNKTDLANRSQTGSYELDLHNSAQSPLLLEPQHLGRPLLCTTSYIARVVCVLELDPCGEGRHDHEAGTYASRDLEVESRLDFLPKKVLGDMAHESIINGCTRDSSETFWPYPSEWKPHASLAEYEIDEITMEHLDVINECARASGNDEWIWPYCPTLAPNQCICYFGQFDAGLRFQLDDLTKKCLNSFGQAPASLFGEISGLRERFPKPNAPPRRESWPEGGAVRIHSHKDAPNPKYQKSANEQLVIEDELQALRRCERQPLSHSYVDDSSRFAGSRKLFSGLLLEGEVQSTPYKDKEKALLVGALADPRARHFAVVVVLRCTFILEAALQRGENLASRNNDLERHMANMKAREKERINDEVQRTLADYVANQTRALQEEVDLLKEDTLNLERDLLAANGRVNTLNLQKSADEKQFHDQLEGERAVSLKL
ncbi:hypothetical protein GIB67_013585 [Kingdonia uniflora]|uniref:Uncharacterized protein n=1 Tax=Kingdonia uniflora TaxID=39325 RepID=A0A7J7KV24_9MAGN|nr:hypothetical protein GIB67_013585 [Kingdonia uniflora]